jgi:hypothetical protein
VPVSCVAEVISAFQPSFVTARAMSSWSVAMVTDFAPLCFARSATHATSGLPAISASIFPGKRVERMRAGMTTWNAGCTRGAYGSSSGRSCRASSSSITGMSSFTG